MVWLDRLKMAAKGPGLIVFVLLSLKCYLGRMVIFGDFHAGKWLVTSVISVLALVLLVELFASKRRFFWLMLLSGILTGIIFAAIMYHKYYGVIVTYKALAQVNQVFQVHASVMDLTDPYYILIFTDVVLMGVLYWSNRRFRNWVRLCPRLDRRVSAGLLAISLAVCSANVLGNTSIYNEVTKAREMGLINYEVYEIVNAFRDPKGSGIPVTAQGVQRMKQTVPLANEDKEFWGTAKGRNVIVIQMESLQNFLIGLEVEGKEITPNLNRLLETSIYFPRIYQQVGQGNTSDAEFVLNTSLYIPPDGAASQVYADKELPGFPKILKTYGYQSMTFHTNDIKFWNRDMLYSALGIDYTYDDNFFGDEEWVAFGASDDVLYEKTLPVLLKQHESGVPFYANIISMSAHHPYHLPEDMAELELPAHYRESLAGRYLISQHYADAALGRFLDKLKQTSLWEDSLIVIYGDHMGLPMYSMEEEDFQLVKKLTGREYSYAGMLNIPLIIVLPGVVEEGRVISHVGGQVDIMPTMANLLGIPLDSAIHFGQDLINQSSNLLPERYYLPTGSFINDEVIFIPEEDFGDGTGYTLDGGQPVKPQEEWKDDFQRAMRLLEMSDAYVESLPERE